MSEIEKSLKKNSSKIFKERIKLTEIIQPTAVTEQIEFDVI